MWKYKCAPFLVTAMPFISSCTYALVGGMLASSLLFPGEIETARRQFKNAQYEAALDTLDRAEKSQGANQQPIESLREEIKSRMRSEAPLALRLAARELKAGWDREATKHFEIALSGNLTNEQRLSALDGRCRVYAKMRNAELAYQACSEAAREAEASSEIRELFAYWVQELRTKHGQAVDAAIAQDRGTEARAHWRSYKELPGAREDRVQRWDKEIATIEQRNEEAARRQAEIREAERKEKERAARQRLARRYAFVTGFSKERFERWVESRTTVLGVQIFERAQISGSGLYLWLHNPQFFGPNLRLFAEYGDAFAVWCKCSAITYVGVDYSHLGSGQAILARFVFDAEAGRSIAR
jgi:hypothetical protein